MLSFLFLLLVYANVYGYEWTVLQSQGQVPQTLFHHTGQVTSTNKLIIFSGEICCGTICCYDLSNDTSVVSLENGIWYKSNSTKYPINRSDHSSIITKNDILYIFYGTIISYTEAVWSYDYRLDFWQNYNFTGIAPPFNTYDHSTVLLSDDKTVLLFGGRTHTQDLYAYDLEMANWQLIQNISGNAPPPRTNHGAAVTEDDRMIIYGGNYYGSVKNDVFIFDIKTNSWFEITSFNGISPKLYGHSFNHIGFNQFFIYGGFRFVQYDDAYIFDLNLALWAKIQISGQGPGKIDFFSASQSRQNMKRIAIFGGLPPISNDIFLVDVFQYTSSNDVASFSHPFGILFLILLTNVGILVFDQFIFF